MSESSTVFQTFLRNELQRRCQRNPKYSLRAFARSLALDPGALSRIVNGKQIPSYTVTQKLVGQLNLTPSEKSAFLASIAESYRVLRRIPANRLLDFITDNAAPEEVEGEVWSMISEWYHAAIMEMTCLPDFRSDARWIAAQLKIDVDVAQSAIDRLLKLELLTWRSGRLIKSRKLVTSKDKRSTSLAHRKLQRRLLEKAIESLENDPLEERNMTSMTMAIDESKLEEAKKLIQDFSRKLCAFLESEKPSRVFQMTVSLYPLQKSCLQGAIQTMDGPVPDRGRISATANADHPLPSEFS